MALAEVAAYSGQAIETPRGYYIRWSPGEGVELWAQATLDREIMGLHPHFSGSSRVRARVTKTLPDSRSPMDGSLHAWADPHTEPGSGAYPFLVDMPDFAAATRELNCPGIVTLQVAAFAHQLQCFPDDQAFRSPDNPIQGMAAETFIPSGLVTPDGKAVKPPQARAIFTGHIAAFLLRTNPVTGESFHHLTVQPPGGVFDVVAHESVLEGEPRIGGVAFGSFWLTGRIVHRR